jgi:uncharacterized membrane protein YphA (DoxX/SURF4 family)
MAVLMLALRVALGALLVVAGVLKAHDGAAVTASTIAAYRILPPIAVAPLALFLPYFEIGLGGYLVLGLFTRAAGYVAAVQFVAFAAAVASLVVRGIPASCGCFGAGQNEPPSWGHVGFDLLLAALALVLARLGPGLLALDARLGAGGALDAANGRDTSSPSTGGDDS